MARSRRPRGGHVRGPRRRKRPPRPQATPHRIPDTPEAQLEEDARRDVERLMKMRAKDLGLSEAERMLDRIISQHPEHEELFSKAGEWTVTGHEDSPFLHVALHRLVEQRVVSREIGRFDANVPWHEAVHAAAEDIAEEMFSSDDEVVETG
ncbi:MAG TPA: DUF1841 family protein [Actinomycetota bacterium]|nr:DUF1841 family protein [Actinomycetota bacterium]